MEESTSNPFRNAGLALLVIGVIDIGVMAYCIANKISYSSSFNIFAVIAGIFLLKGGVKTARIIRWFSVFMAVGLGGMFFMTPLITPFGLLATQLKLDTVSTLGSYAFGLLGVAFLIWLHLQLSTAGSLQKLKESGYKTGKPKSAYIAAIAFLAIFVGFFSMFLGGESADKAKELAQNKLGAGYKYHISSMSTSGNSGHALVLAYSDSEIKGVQVKW